MGIDVFDIFEEISHIPYKLGEWDCLHLVKYLYDRTRSDIDPMFPDILDKYVGMGESEASDAIASDIELYCQRCDELRNGCFVMIKMINRRVLGFYYDGYCFYMGEQAKYVAVDRLVDFDSFTLISNANQI